MGSCVRYSDSDGRSGLFTIARYFEVLFLEGQPGSRWHRTGDHALVAFDHRITSVWATVPLTNEGLGH